LHPAPPQAAAWNDTLVLFLAIIVFVGLGIWWGWIQPHIARLEQIRIELRELDRKPQVDEPAGDSTRPD